MSPLVLWKDKKENPFVQSICPGWWGSRLQIAPPATLLGHQQLGLPVSQALLFVIKALLINLQFFKDRIFLRQKGGDFLLVPVTILRALLLYLTALERGSILFKPFFFCYKSMNWKSPHVLFPDIITSYRKLDLDWEKWSWPRGHLDPFLPRCSSAILNLSNFPCLMGIIDDNF